MTYLISAFAIGVLIGLFFRTGAMIFATLVALAAFFLRPVTPQPISFIDLVMLVAVLQLGYLIGVGVAITVRNHLR